MKIYVVSDTHGKTDEFIDKVREIGKPDMIFFLGDYAEDGEKIKRELGLPLIGVRGNNDVFNPIYEKEELVEINNFKFFLTHGHEYNVNFTLNNLYLRGKELAVDCVLFGHTHQVLLEYEDGIYLLNPGSPSLPRSRIFTF